MASIALPELQEISKQMLDDYILDPAILLTSYPLDYGRHNVVTQYDLGDLAKLPTEVLHLVLKQVDIESLLNFRRVNNMAMYTVDGVTEYKQVRRVNFHLFVCCG